MASDAALNKIMSHDFLGNVRELENIILSAISLADKEHVLTERHIRIDSIGSTKSSDAKVNLSEGLDKCLLDIEERLVREALLLSNGNITKASERLKIKRQTLQHKIKKYDNMQNNLHIEAK